MAILKSVPVFLLLLSLGFVEDVVGQRGQLQETLLEWEHLGPLGKHIREEMREAESTDDKMMEIRSALIPKMEAYNDSVNQRFDDFQEYCDGILRAKERLSNRLSPYFLQFSEQTPLTAFNARITTAMFSGNTDDTVIFDDTDYNEGWQYETDDGVFTARYSGPYLFVVRLAPPYSAQNKVKLLFVKNGNQPFGSVTSDKEPVSNMFLVELVAGETIQMKFAEPGDVGGGFLSHFMGFNL